MYPGGFSTELWMELMWNFLWVLMIPVAITLILMILTVIAETISRGVPDPQRKNKVSTLR